MIQESQHGQEGERGYGRGEQDEEGLSEEECTVDGEGAEEPESEVGEVGSREFGGGVAGKLADNGVSENLYDQREDENEELSQSKLRKIQPNSIH